MIGCDKDKVDKIINKVAKIVKVISFIIVGIIIIYMCAIFRNI